MGSTKTRRRRGRPDNPRCSKCGGHREGLHRYCRACKAAYMRAWRPKHSELPPEQRRRANARAYAGVYKRRGKLKPAPCEVCGSPDVEMHHDDYDRPLAVRWFCRAHHLELERILEMG